MEEEGRKKGRERGREEREGRERGKKYRGSFTCFTVNLVNRVSTPFLLS